jgi:hypothetical protein
MAGGPVLVTGATGYIGGRLVPLLEGADVRLRCLARHPAALLCLAATGALLGACQPAGVSGLDPLPSDTRPNQPPVVSISLPVAGTAFVLEESVAFRDAAIDPEDGQVWGTAMTWTSDRDGVLYDGSNGGAGPGSAFHWEELSVGQHIVTLVARDQRGATAQASVTITVNP